MDEILHNHAEWNEKGIEGHRGTHCMWNISKLSKSTKNKQK